jgi:hypothetical protein
MSQVEGSSNLWEKKRLNELRRKIETMEGFPEGEQRAANHITVFPTPVTNPTYPVDADNPMRKSKSQRFHPDMPRE